MLDPASTPISAELAPALGGAADMSKLLAIDLEKLPDGFRLQPSIFVAARKAFADLEGKFTGAPEYLVLHLLGFIKEQNIESLEPVYDEDHPVGRTGDMRTWFTSKPACVAI